MTGMVATFVAAFFLSNFEYKFFWMGLMYALLCRATSWSASRHARRPPSRGP